MTVDKYLKKLALNNRRVIIPDLGAFLSKEGDDNGSNLIFSSFLKYNDGFLENHIAEKEGITVGDSLALIQQFVERVNRVTKSKQRYEVEGFGYFYMDERGGIAFSTDSGKEQAVAAPVQTEKPIEPVKPVVVAPVVEKEPVVKVETKQTVVSPPPSSYSSAGKNVEVKKETTTQQKGNNNGLLLVIVVLLLVILLLFCSYFMFDGVRTKVDQMLGKKPCITEQPVAVAPAVIEQPVDTAAVVSTPVEPKPTAPVVSATASGMYYVIVGTFLEKSNADKMYARCTADGYKPEMLPMMGDFYPVAVTKASSWQEAEKIMWEMKDKYGDAWVFKSRR